MPANPPSVVAYSFRVCHESEVFHGHESNHDRELLAYAERLNVASTATSSPRSSSGARIHVVLAKPRRPPPRTHILTLRAPLVSWTRRSDWWLPSIRTLWPLSLRPSSRSLPGCRSGRSGRSTGVRSVRDVLQRLDGAHRRAREPPRMCPRAGARGRTRAVGGGEAARRRARGLARGAATSARYGSQRGGGVPRRAARR